MTIEDCYQAMGADYEDVSHRIPNPAHTLKGLCLTLGFSALAKPSIELTELLRGRRMDGYEPLYEQVVTEYEKTVAALRQVD